MASACVTKLKGDHSSVDSISCHTMETSYHVCEASDCYSSGRIEVLRQSPKRILIAMNVLIFAILWGGAVCEVQASEIFTNAFFVEMKQPADRKLADQVANRNGFVNLGSVLGSHKDYHFIHRAIPHARSKRSVPHTRRLKIDPLVWITIALSVCSTRFINIHTAVQQIGFRRVKRGYRDLSADDLVPSSSREFMTGRVSNEPTDPYFQYQWYLKNTGQNGGKPKLDLNVEAAWAQGVTGKNITTAIMDDGVDYMHPDLKYNYNAPASYDFSSNDPFPYPRYTDDWFNRLSGNSSWTRKNHIQTYYGELNFMMVPIGFELEGYNQAAETRVLNFSTKLPWWGELEGGCCQHNNVENESS